MIVINAPSGSTFQVMDFGDITFEFPVRDGGQPSTGTGATIDEIIFSNSGNEDDTSQIDFIKRYNTWFCFTNIKVQGTDNTAFDTYTYKPAQLIFINYDRQNKIAYTHTENVRLQQSRP
jgi:hypothetical protein